MMNKWLSIEDELPKENIPVIGFLKIDNNKHDIAVVVRLVLADENGEYSDFYRYSEDRDIKEIIGDQPEDVTHWMPLPEPPRG